MAVVGNWTYSGDPRDSSLDAVRFLIGDTDSDNQMISNEEISWLLAENADNVYLAAAAGAKAIGATYADRADKSVGDLSISYSQSSKQYSELATRLGAQASSPGVTAISPFAGGISKDDKQTQQQDTDWDRPFAELGFTDYPGVGTIRNSSWST